MYLKSDRVVKKTQTQMGSDGLRCLIWAFLSEKIVWEYHFNVINYAVQNPTVNIMKDFFDEAC
jgi:hypothetical protein